MTWWREKIQGLAIHTKTPRFSLCNDAVAAPEVFNSAQTVESRGVRKVEAFKSSEGTHSKLSEGKGEI